jgi:hypothetical protein
VKSSAVELKDELHSIRLTFVWKKQQECNLRDMITVVKGGCNDIERQN